MMSLQRICLMVVIFGLVEQGAEQRSTTDWERYYLVNHGCHCHSCCTTSELPDRCHVDQWSDWTECSATCAPLAEKSRTRACRTDTCPSGVCDNDRLQETVKCQTADYPCCEGYPKWLAWGPWDKECGTGCGLWAILRKRECVRCPYYELCHVNLTDLPQYEEQKKCEDACPATCRRKPKWGPWKSWSSCSKTCGGTRTRTRKCKEKKCSNGSYCLGEWEEDERCPNNCTSCKKMKWRKWNSWSECTTTCGRGTQTRKRRCKKSKDCPKEAKCEGEQMENKVCFNWCCEDLALGPWEPWSECSTTCGKGEKLRTRSCEAKNCQYEAEHCASLVKQSRNCLVHVKRIGSCRQG